MCIALTKILINMFKSSQAVSGEIAIRRLDVLCWSSKAESDEALLGVWQMMKMTTISSRMVE